MNRILFAPFLCPVIGLRGTLAFCVPLFQEHVVSVGHALSLVADFISFMHCITFTHIILVFSFLTVKKDFFIIC